MIYPLDSVIHPLYNWAPITSDIHDLTIQGVCDLHRVMADGGELSPNQQPSYTQISSEQSDCYRINLSFVKNLTTNQAWARQVAKPIRKQNLW